MSALLAGFGTGAAAEPDIYRCEQVDGTVAFQQLPCRPTPVVQPDARPAETSQIDAAAETPPAASDATPAADSAPPGSTDDDTSERAPVPVSGNRADCEKSTRDAIDAIDAELQASVDTDKDRARLDELLELTQRLRMCKQL